MKTKCSLIVYKSKGFAAQGFKANGITIEKEKTKISKLQI